MFSKVLETFLIKFLFQFFYVTYHHRICHDHGTLSTFVASKVCRLGLMLLGASVVKKFRFRHLSGILILTFDGLTFAKSHFFALPFVVNLNILYEQFQ